jgi:hypothetical protein
MNEIKNKPIRDAQRRLLHKNGWIAVEALKDNGAFQFKWIHRKYKRAYSRVKAVEITKRWNK